MIKRQIFIVASIVTMILFFSACEKKGTTEPENNPTAAAEKVTQANEILIPKIILLANGADPGTIDFSSATTLYQEALTLDPNNADAHFGAALTDILSLAGNTDIQNLFDGNILSLPPEFLKSLTSSSSGTPQLLSSFGKDMKGTILGSFTGRISKALGKGAAMQAGPMPSYYQNIVETALLPKVISAIDHLSAVLQNTGYAFLVTPQMTGESETFRIDATEIYLFKAFLQLVATEGSAMVAYNIDYNSQDSVAVYQAWQSGSAFLSFRTNGSQRMKDTRTYFTGAASSIQAGLNYLMTEPPNPQTDIINYNPADQQEFQQVILSLDTLKAVLAGPYTFPGAPTVNFKNFFDDAIPNYKQMVPPYTVSVQRNLFTGQFEAVLTWTAASFNAWIFPDPTMRGLFPGMTDANLKLLMEVSASNWEQTVLIPGF